MSSLSILRRKLYFRLMRTLPEDKVRLVLKFYLTRISRKVFIVLFPTFRCNYRCPYCPIEQGQYAQKYPKEVEHRWEDWVRVMDTFPAAEIAIAGGEPLVYSDLVPLINNMPDKHAIGMSTNMSIHFEEFLKGVNKKVRLTTSFHPHTDDINSLSEKVLKAKHYGFTPSVNYVAYPDNLRNIHETAAFFEKELRVPFNVDPYVCPGHTYTPDEISKVKPYLQSFRKLDCDPPGTKSHLKRCWAGSRLFLAFPNGDVHTCHTPVFFHPNDSSYLGNLFAGSFKPLTTPRICSLPCDEPTDLQFAFVEPTASKSPCQNVPDRVP